MADRKMLRCLGCGEWARRSRCSTCRKIRKQALIDGSGGRYTRKALRRQRLRQRKGLA